MKKKSVTSNIKYISVFILIFLIVSVHSFAQKRNKVYDEYIGNFSDIAVNNMQKHKIPASITMAQALLESGAGKSELAKKSNNHFGIKCHTGWSGKNVKADDDYKGECFRKYDRVEDSFEDHSLFLTSRKHYNPLFALDISDYKSWAKGLQKAGYATDKAYANKLIKLIEDYELYEFDKASAGNKQTQKTQPSERPKNTQTRPTKENQNIVIANRHTPYKKGTLVYVIGKKGDTYASIAKEFGFNVKDLCKYNEVNEDFPIQPGDYIFFQSKRSKSDKPYYEHVVQIGESMHSISQKYAIKVKSLYKLNKRDSDYLPTEGDILRLR